MTLFSVGFLSIRLLDIIDILLVSLLIYLLYKLVKGSIAFNIFLGILSVYLIWQLVLALNMQLLSTILGQFIGVGVLALLIVFQQEVRRFLLLIGKNSPIFNNPQSWRRILPWNWRTDIPKQLNIDEIVNACSVFSKKTTGALIVIARTSELKYYTSTGVPVLALITTRLLESIFQKNSPLHDGAVIIAGNRILAASCVLPVSEKEDIPGRLGMRHRAALGISEQTDALTIIVSEETGNISVADNGVLFYKIEPLKLKDILTTEFMESEE